MRRYLVSPHRRWPDVPRLSEVEFYDPGMGLGVIAREFQLGRAARRSADAKHAFSQVLAYLKNLNFICLK